MLGYYQGLGTYSTLNPQKKKKKKKANMVRGHGNESNPSLTA